MTSRALRDVSFCHLVIGVTDMDRALAFYRDVIGMEVVFEPLVSGEPFDAVLHAKRKQKGRVVGGLDNIRVNVICPFAESDGVKTWKQFAPNDYAKAVGRVPMKRVGDVRTDVGALVAFLLSTDATFITAQTIHVDGGIGCFR